MTIDKGKNHLHVRPSSSSINELLKLYREVEVKEVEIPGNKSQEKIIYSQSDLEIAISGSEFNVMYLHHKGNWLLHKCHSKGSS